MRKLPDVVVGDSRVRISYRSEGDRNSVLVEDASDRPGLDLKRLRTEVANKVQAEGVDLESTTFLERDWSGNVETFQLEPRDQLAQQAPEVQSGNAKYQLAGEGPRTATQSEAEQIWGESFGPSQKQVDQEFQENMNLSKSMWNDPRMVDRSQDFDPTD